jgi:transposase
MILESNNDFGRSKMGYLMMSTKERQLKALLEMVKQRNLSLATVSAQMEMSYRQIKRIYKRYRQEGDAGLIHKSRGHNTNH